MVPGITHLFVKIYMEKFLKSLLEMQELIDIILCVILMHTKNNLSIFDDGSSGSGYVLPSDSTTEALVSLSTTIIFIDCWLQGLEHNSLECYTMYLKLSKLCFRKSQFNF